ncbi:Nitrogenase iron-molybdenum cofactor biosynthesis nifE [Gossypium arboreum]|uniref:Nitrogenase iron-molybdenum cofactor biosynthesis nifE n=1 Tax=Gossypium arboreum TaxID=29729 RepID=A0A0B0PA72_GOSAR|nr:Nitrogenase iron-molybdenum cofactor biosynthesis nifE [Gossypium arboreum]
MLYPFMSKQIDLFSVHNRPWSQIRYSSPWSANCFKVFRCGIAIIVLHHEAFE